MPPLLALAVTLAALVGYGLWRRAIFRRGIKEGIARIRSSPAPAPRHRADDALPPPLRRFLARALPDGAPRCAWCRIEQRGAMRLRPGSAWRPFHAQQWIALDRPAFVWDARFPRFLGVGLRVVDRLDGEDAALEARLLDLVPLARAHGPALVLAQACRYLAELAWFPMAASLGPGLEWTGLDETRFAAEHSGACGVARVEYELGAEDDLVRVTGIRPRTVGKDRVPTAWFGEFGEHELLCGIRIPTRAEVTWELQEGPFAYWRGEILAVDLAGGEGPPPKRRCTASTKRASAAGD